MPFSLYGANSGAALGRPDRVQGTPLEVPKELQHWYDGKTKVTLPDGRVIQPSKNTFLKYYEGAWSGRVLPDGEWQLSAGRVLVGNRRADVRSSCADRAASTST